jgi:hypothetical protein
VDIESPSNLLD